jgi:hypothetical protein
MIDLFSRSCLAPSSASAALTWLQGPLSRLTAVPQPCIKLKTTRCLPLFHLASTKATFIFSFLLSLFVLLGTGFLFFLVASCTPSGRPAFRILCPAYAFRLGRSLSRRRRRFLSLSSPPTPLSTGACEPLVTHSHPTPSPALPSRTTVNSVGLEVHLTIVSRSFYFIFTAACVSAPILFAASVHGTADTHIW